jgi:hypothetical protein
MTVRIAFVADIFPDCPGVEIAVVHRCFERTHSAIQDYDTRGEKLYQVWADVDVANMLWEPETRTLVVAGRNGEHFLWERDRGVTAGSGSHPLVVFGLQPEPNADTNDYVVQEVSASAATRSAWCPRWYWCVVPLSASSLAEIQEGAGVFLDRDGLLFAVHFPLRDDTTASNGLTWKLSRDGRLQSAAPRAVPDAARYDLLRSSALPDLPPLDAWRLDDLPPVLHPSPGESPAPKSRAASQ